MFAVKQSFISTTDRLYAEVPQMTNWTSLCRRTNDPKLAYIETALDGLGIAHRRNGLSFHAPILEVPSAEHLRAFETILLAPDADYGVLDDRPDDDAMFGSSVAEGMLCLACGAYDHTADACPTEQPPADATDAARASAPAGTPGEPTLAPHGPTGLVGAAYEADLRARHAGCSICGGAGWIVEELRAPMKLCRREPPF